MLIDRLNYHGFNFEQLPDEVKIDIDLITTTREATQGLADQKISVLDLAVFETIEVLYPKNSKVKIVRTELDFDRKLDSNNSFNTKGIVDLSPEQFKTVLEVDEMTDEQTDMFFENEQEDEDIETDFGLMKQGGQAGKKKALKSIADLKSIDTSSLINAGEQKVGYRKKFLNTPILIGRERDIILPNGETHDSIFAIVELDEILASHNEKTFSSTESYPKTKSGRNINDRNYSDDKNAQAKVQNIAQKLEPDLMISTSVDSDGTPIISVDGIVVSGNNRTMSLKLANSDFNSRYAEYIKTLENELEQGGYGLYGIDKKSFKDKGFKAPVLVRIDTDFQSYLTEEMNKYNVESKKSERPIDQAIRISQQLEDNENCKKSLINLVSTQETVSGINKDSEAIRRVRKILLSCGLISDNEISKYFNENQFTTSGTVLYQTILSSLVLFPKSLQISQNNGVRRSTKSIVNGIIPAIKNKQFEIGSLNSEINLAILLQNKVVNSEIGSITDYIYEPELFEKEEEVAFSPAVIGLYLMKGGNAFKEKLLTYNSSMEQNQTENMFGAPIKPEVIFYETFVQNLPFQQKILVLKRFNEYVGSLEISINEYESQLDQATPELQPEIKNMIKTLVELRNFAI